MVACLLVWDWPATAAAPQPPGQVEHVPPDEAFAILGSPVAAPDGKMIGRLVDVLVDASGAPEAAVIDFGGFMGVGARKIAVHWSTLHFAPANPKQPITLDLTLDQIKAAPEYRNPSKPAPVVLPAKAKTPEETGSSASSSGAAGSGATGSSAPSSGTTGSGTAASGTVGSGATGTGTTGGGASTNGTTGTGATAGGAPSSGTTGSGTASSGATGSGTAASGTAASGTAASGTTGNGATGDGAARSGAAGDNSTTHSQAAPPKSQ